MTAAITIARPMPEAYGARIKRPGVVNAWAYPEFRDAVLATGRKNLIMAGVTTDVCLIFPAIDAALEGFNVQAVMDASGSPSDLSEEFSRQRMHDTGVVLTANTAMQTFRDVQHHEAVLSHAQQLKNMTAQFGTALGIAASTLMLQWRSTEHYNLLNNRFSVGNPIYTQALHDLSQVLASRGAGPRSESMALAHLAQLLSQQATLLACLDYFSVIAVVGVFGAAAMLFQRLMK